MSSLEVEKERRTKGESKQSRNDINEYVGQYVFLSISGKKSYYVVLTVLRILNQADVYFCFIYDNNYHSSNNTSYNNEVKKENRRVVRNLNKAET